MSELRAPLQWLPVTLLVAGLFGLTSVDWRHGSLRGPQITESTVWYLIAFAGFVTAAWTNERKSIPLRWVWVLAIVLRLLMLTTPPTLSDDVYRYLWDGHLAAEGVNPYEFAIDDPAGDPYDIDVRALANNRQLSSPYLPAAHAVFGASALVLPSEPLSLQAVMVGFDLLTAALLARLLAIAKLPSRRLLLYLWNPFVIVELAHGAHLDAVMVALTCGALVLTFMPRPTSTGIRSLVVAGGPALLALATLTRPIPALLLPVLFWKWSWPQRLVYGVVAGVVVLPFARGPGFGLRGELTGTGVFGSARAYTETFRFNSSIYYWLETWISGRGLDDRGWDEPIALTRLIITIATLLGLAVVALIARRSDLSERRALRLMMVPVGLYAILTPVFHPWYAVILVVLAIFTTPGDDEPASRWFVMLPWAYLSAALFFSYRTYLNPEAHAEVSWVRWLEWAPTLALITALGVWRLLPKGADPTDRPRPLARKVP